VVVNGRWWEWKDWEKCVLLQPRNADMELSVVPSGVLLLMAWDRVLECRSSLLTVTLWC